MTVGNSLKEYVNFLLTPEQEIERERLVSQMKLLVMLDSPVNIDVRDYPELSSHPLEMAMCVLHELFKNSAVTVNPRIAISSSFDLYASLTFSLSKQIVFCFVEQKVNTFLSLPVLSTVTLSSIEKPLVKAIESFKSKPKERIKPTLD